MFKKIIDRPVSATVVAVIIFLLGLLALKSLPMETFPDIAPPAVAVTARYPGANAETMARAVATPLEQVINGVENMTYMSSTSSNDGTLTITVFFKQGTNPDQAAVNVQNRVAQASNQLPKEVLQAGVITAKQQNGMIMFIDIYSDDRYDGEFVNNYTLINLIPQIQRIQGVGKAALFGSKDYAMRIWLNPAQLTAYRISPQEVIEAINNQNLEAAPGRLGEGSNVAYEYAIRYKGKLNQEPDYENLLIRADENGKILRLKDIARIELGSLDHAYAAAVSSRGRPDAGIFVFQVPGSNANDIQTAIFNLLKKAKKSFPAGLDYTVSYSTKTFLDEAIDQVKHTFIEAFILVFIVVFIFLQDLRSTIIPAITVLVSIVGTFFFMKLLGLTINMLTLFALVLAIGIVVDDAIVVVEAVHTKLGHNVPPRNATVSAMSEITGVIISITLVMAAVFLPVSLIDGPVGMFYRQFAFTLAIAIILSAINALTLSPALCAILLKAGHTNDQKGIRRIFHLFNLGFDAATAKYIRAAQVLIRHKGWTMGGLVVIVIATVILAQKVPKAFIPTEDQSTLISTVNLAPGAGYTRTKKLLDSVEHLVSKIDGVDFTSIVVGENLMSASVSPSFGSMYTALKPKKDRGKFADINAIADSVNKIFYGLPEGNSYTFNLPTVQGFGTIDGLDVVLKDNTGAPITKLADQANKFIAALLKQKEIGTAYTSFNANYPQYQLDVDDVRAKQFGLEVSDVLSTMQAYYGSIYASDFNRFGKYYRVVVQADIPFRVDEQSLQYIQVKNKQGEMVPMTAVAQLKRVFGPEVINHLNQSNAITISVQAAKGYSSDDAMKTIDQVASQLPHGYAHEYIGMAREEQAAGSQTVFVFGLCVIFVYLLLSSQYESYVLPLAVMLTLPTGILGVFTFIWWMGVSNNIYVQITLIMLIGLLAKNAILIVEFAVQRRRAGHPLVEAALEAARLRLRPILMTSLAFIAGMLPLLFAKGATEQGNVAIASGAIGGMLFGVVLGVFITPVLFIIFQALQEKIFGNKHRLPALAIAKL
ncbi:efflux RND transporter permease subunit [Chitinophaga pendula]|uniref:efflux RND transporter permease subunit n=1 Tax=Chitinophaga TaxID=79328 RepID=UPI000BAF599E|nr:MULTISPECIES: efflux RND transporter permease subunit [Chitinophaga]ASZ11219.1 hydrophobe/amphiphile efflux-1 family RND transporter [Chitinophaga sp. MD30]UCJ05784.1 efflux RND transporter permease subunit [Chitinophaga pendula]